MPPSEWPPRVTVRRPALAGLCDDGVEVVHGHGHAPLLHEGELRGLEGLVVVGDRRVGQKAEVVVEGLLIGRSPGQHRLDQRVVLEGALPAHLGPDLEIGDVGDQVRGDQVEVAGPPVGPGYQYEHVGGPGRAEAADRHLVVLGRRRRPVGNGRCGHDCRRGHGEDRLGYRGRCAEGHAARRGRGRRAAGTGLAVGGRRGGRRPPISSRRTHHPSSHGLPPVSVGTMTGTRRRPP